LRRVMLRIHKRIHCLVHECHCKLAKWLCENYRIIILPEFHTQRMIRRGQRRILSGSDIQRNENSSRDLPQCLE
ncbi:216_t:CDS:2, partial [Dentiscutata heterogama]